MPILNEVLAASFAKLPVIVNNARLTDIAIWLAFRLENFNNGVRVGIKYEGAGDNVPIGTFFSAAESDLSEMSIAIRNLMSTNASIGAATAYNTVLGQRQNIIVGQTESTIGNGSVNVGSSANPARCGTFTFGDAAGKNFRVRVPSYATVSASFRTYGTALSAAERALADEVLENDRLTSRYGTELRVMKGLTVSSHDDLERKTNQRR